MEFSPLAQAKVERRTRPERGRVLCFAPHPDDEALGVGGTLHLHVRQADPVRIVVATDGAAGDPEKRFDAATYRERRRRESREAMAILGVQDVAFWGLPDSCVITEKDLEGLAARVASAARDYGAEVVYLPWAGDGNSDHLALHEAVVRGLGRAGFEGRAYGYEVWSPNPRPDVVVDITELVELKRRALEHYQTQMAYVDLVHPVLGMNSYRSLLLERSRGYGEAFSRIRVHGQDGPVGPDGPDGPVGPDGPDGPDGQDETDGQGID